MISDDVKGGAVQLLGPINFVRKPKHKSTTDNMSIMKY